MSQASITVKRRQYLELENLALGAFSPLTGFMNEEEFCSVVESMHLPGGELFPLPVVFDLTPEQAREVERADKIGLVFEGHYVGEITPQSIFTCDKALVAEQVFGTRDASHPGVAQIVAKGRPYGISIE